MKILRSLRQAYKVSQMQIATLLGVPQNVISGVERGIRKTRLDIAPAVLEYMYPIMVADEEVPRYELSQSQIRTILERNLLVQPGNTSVCPMHFVVKSGKDFIFCASNGWRQHTCGVQLEGVHSILVPRPDSSEDMTPQEIVASMKHNTEPTPAEQILKNREPAAVAVVTAPRVATGQFAPVDIDIDDLEI